jgi:hypothetical protein
MYPKTSWYSESSVILRLNGRNIVSAKFRSIEVFIFQRSILSLEENKKIIPKFDHKMMECDSTVLYDFCFIDILVDSNLNLLFVVRNASNGKRDIFDQSY